MPHSLSAAKRLRQTKKRTQRNKMWKGKIKAAVKGAKAGMAQGTVSQEELRKAIQLIDRAISKGILHKNTGARKKSRLMRQMNKKSAAKA